MKHIFNTLLLSLSSISATASNISQFNEIYPSSFEEQGMNNHTLASGPLASGMGAFDEILQLAFENRGNLPLRVSTLITRCLNSDCPLPQEPYGFVYKVFSQTSHGDPILKIALLEALEKNGYQINLSKNADGHIFRATNKDDPFGIQIITEFCQEHDCFIPEETAMLFTGALDSNNSKLIAAITRMLLKYDRVIDLKKIYHQTPRDITEAFGELTKFCNAFPKNCKSIESVRD